MSTDPTENLEQFAVDDGCVDEPKPLFPAISMKELMGGDYRLNYLCRGILVENQPMIIGGPFKSFKTSLMLNLAVNLATGTSFLNRFECPEPVKVCMFLGEGGLGNTQDVLRRIGRFENLDIADIENLIVTDKIPKLDNVEHLAAVEEYLNEHTPAVAIFDPVYLALSGADTSNVFSMGDRLRALNDICLPRNCTPMLLHHLRKNRADKYAPAGLDDLSMAGFAEYAGQWILLSRRVEYDPDDPIHRLWISFGGRAGHGSAWGLDIHEGTVDDEGGRNGCRELRRQDDVRSETHGQQAQRQVEKGKAKQAEFEATSNRALGWLTGKPEGVTKRTLKAHLRVGDNKVEQVVSFLEESNSIEPCKIEVKNNKSTREVDGFRAVKSEDDETLFI